MGSPTRKDGRIESGQKLSTAISARAWNRAQDAADIVLGERSRFAADGGKSHSAPYTWIYGSSAAAVSRWDAVAITGMSVTPTDNDTDDATVQFASMPVATIAAPTSTTTAVAVAIEPIRAGGVGKIAVAGAVQVRRADLAKLANARVLWKNDNWAFVSLDSGVIRVGTITGSWLKGWSKEVDECDQDFIPLLDENDTQIKFYATNWFATVAVTGNPRKVACGNLNGSWILLAAECDG